MADNRLLLNDTGLEIVDKLDQLNTIMASQVGKDTGLITTFQQLEKIVQNNMAQKIFSVGDQIVIKYTNPDNTAQSYDCPLDVVSFNNVTDKDGNEKPAMWLQFHFATLQGVMFAGYQAFYLCKTKLSAGTYNITWGANWGTYIKSGASWQFTLTKDVPAGGYLTGFYQAPDKDNSTCKVYSWESNTSKTPIEEVSISSGSGGTNLGTIYYNKRTEVLGSMYDICYGYNRWSQSAIRQWLNSDGSDWWQPQSDFDHRPDQYSLKGFMAGLPDDFKAIIKPIQVKTSANTLIDGGVTDVTYDKFFLPSLEQIYITPQIKGIEGDYWEYWKERVGTDSSTAQYTTQEERKTYALESHTSAQYVRLRSANRGSSNNTWIVNTTGNVNNNHAIWANRCSPACVIY